MPLRRRQAQSAKDNDTRHKIEYVAPVFQYCHLPDIYVIIFLAWLTSGNQNIKLFK